jgi:hypothetical protein
LPVSLPPPAFAKIVVPPIATAIAAMLIARAGEGLGIVLSTVPPQVSS